MPSGTASALTIVRVPRGRSAPSQEELRAAIEQDRMHLHLPPHDGLRDLAVAGPYAVTVDGTELDEYVLWEH